jgi:hypothetical protein
MIARAIFLECLQIDTKAVVTCGEDRFHVVEDVTVGVAYLFRMAMAGYAHSYDWDPVSGTQALKPKANGQHGNVLRFSTFPRLEKKTNIIGISWSSWAWTKDNGIEGAEKVDIRLVEGILYVAVDPDQRNADIKVLMQQRGNVFRKGIVGVHKKDRALRSHWDGDGEGCKGW